MKKRYTNKEIIEKFNKIHNNKYDYSKVNYVSSNTKVCIICPEHGEFWQTPGSHLYRAGCPKCGGTMLYTTDEFIEKAKEIHRVLDKLCILLYYNLYI